MALSRRAFLCGVASAGLGWPAVAGGQARRPPRVFEHGVASGDPLADRVVLWTRVTSASGSAAEAAWTIARDPGFDRVAARGVVGTDASRDHTVKVDVPGLQPSTTYYYRFEHAGVRSPIGRTRTLPVGRVDRVRLGIVSCSNFPFGFFNAYARLAARADLDAVLHLGDYLYEYENGRYGDGTPFGRVPSPDRELVTLADYRQRHAQYKSDPDLQEVHRQHPFITVWDDHEVADNSWTGGAVNHTPDLEGDWLARKAAAVRAYYDWMPIRESGRSRQIEIHRSFAFGDLVDLIMLDTRLTGRDQQVERANLQALADPARTLLGPAQEAWLAGELVASARAGTAWRLIGQQVIMAPLVNEAGAIRNPDAWDGYAASRTRILDVIARERVGNPVVLTGDVHSSWAMDIARDPFTRAAYDPETGRGALAVEFVGPAVSSPGPYTRDVTPADARVRAEGVRARNPHVKYLEGVHRGYFIVDVTREACQADWFFVPTVDERTPLERFAAAYATAAGTPHVVERREPRPPRAEAPPLAPRTGSGSA